MAGAVPQQQAPVPLQQTLGDVRVPDRERDRRRTDRAPGVRAPRRARRAAPQPASHSPATSSTLTTMPPSSTCEASATAKSWGSARGAAPTARARIGEIRPRRRHRVAQQQVARRQQRRRHQQRQRQRVPGHAPPAAGRAELPGDAGGPVSTRPLDRRAVPLGRPAASAASPSWPPRRASGRRPSPRPKKPWSASSRPGFDQRRLGAQAERPEQHAADQREQASAVNVIGRMRPHSASLSPSLRALTCASTVSSLEVTL